nr:hypothetical protein [Frankia gtarii]
MAQARCRSQQHAPFRAQLGEARHPDGVVLVEVITRHAWVLDATKKDLLDSDFDPSALQRHWDRLLPLLDRTLANSRG